MRVSHCCLGCGARGDIIIVVGEEHVAAQSSPTADTTTQQQQPAPRQEDDVDHTPPGWPTEADLTATRGSHQTVAEAVQKTSCPHLQRSPGIGRQRRPGDEEEEEEAAKAGPAAVERLPERASFWRPSADVALVGPPGIYMFVSRSATSNTLHDESRRTETTTTSLAQLSSARGEPLLASRGNRKGTSAAHRTAPHSDHTPHSCCLWPPPLAPAAVDLSGDFGQYPDASEPNQPASPLPSFFALSSPLIEQGTRILFVHLQ
ncbi:hypothetical protein PCL_00492 [Purpureocillium lilacinum]|uniref:Uncharacterized protein n=1 Tax=Purpureocillium lilacinum TaxID=33203 RepID=A0A2U3E4Z4_PURLI|nr:hypothetical protein PCL_00492 [Purpureocillium lilacinum]